MIGYELLRHDNGAFAFAERNDLRRCVECGHLLAKWQESLAGLKIPRKRKSDISLTYDGLTVMSQKFKDVCKANQLEGTVFAELPDDPGFFAFASNIIVSIDAEQGGVRYETKCSACGKFAWVGRPHPVILKKGSNIPDRGFAQSDLEFAHKDEKCPMIFCGMTAAQILRQAGLKGLDLRPL